MLEEGLSLVADRLRKARRVTVLTGAGVSAASGIPTFRGAGGLWQNHRAEDLATAAAFERDPALVWQWYAMRRDLVASATPNAAHEVLARWTRRWPAAVLITQNVDDLHLRAGSERVVRLHGSLLELSCWSGCGMMPWRDERVPLERMPPRCPLCGGLARPAVVWFGEFLPAAAVKAAEAACDCDVFLSVGTSSLVYPAAGLVHQARLRGAFTVESTPRRRRRLRRWTWCWPGGPTSCCRSWTPDWLERETRSPRTGYAEAAALAVLVVFFVATVAALAALAAVFRCSEVCAPNFLVNRSTRPSVSISFWRPVKNGWHAEQISRCSSGLVERVLNVLPHAHRTSTSLYAGWIPSFTIYSLPPLAAVRRPTAV
jgi:NAD-dependent deacetylase